MMLLPEKKLGNTNNFPFLFFVSESLLCLGGGGGGGISCISVRTVLLRQYGYGLHCTLSYLAYC